jgi:hypothetical protein
MQENKSSGRQSTISTTKSYAILLKKRGLPVFLQLSTMQLLRPMLIPEQLIRHSLNVLVTCQVNISNLVKDNSS